MSLLQPLSNLVMSHFASNYPSFVEVNEGITNVFSLLFFFVNFVLKKKFYPRPGIANAARGAWGVEKAWLGGCTSQEMRCYLLDVTVVTSRNVLVVG